MSAMASQITSLTIVYSAVYSRRRSKKTSKLRVTGLCEGNSPVTGNSPHKGPAKRKLLLFDDVILIYIIYISLCVKTSINQGVARNPFNYIPGIFVCILSVTITFINVSRSKLFHVKWNHFHGSFSLSKIVGIIVVEYILWIYEFMCVLTAISLIH